MNLSHFTTAQIREILPKMLSDGKGLTESGTRYNSDLCELSLEHEMIVTKVDEDKGLVLIEFEQYWDDEIDGWGETIRYTTVQTVPDVEGYIKELIY